VQSQLANFSLAVGNTQASHMHAQPVRIALDWLSAVYKMIAKAGTAICMSWMKRQRRISSAGALSSTANSAGQSLIFN